MSITLKARHSLKGKSLTPIALKLRVFRTPNLEMARLKKEYPLENYMFEELESDFFLLTGEVAKYILMLADISRIIVEM
ncbi:hypothetical protein KUTeg_012269 [Tegillarca granosa]|uniref:Uncharacterized protein n=1 Tax=Tegillarca granosa TaxID=220873 RepID=A0ABQ9EZ12_TEGGR|nr:hypothetical protein KUTeg_012269 [Tegillarca granosa]